MCVARAPDFSFDLSSTLGNFEKIKMRIIKRLMTENKKYKDIQGNSMEPKKVLNV